MINKTDIKIWGREFSLRIDYDCYAGETVADDQVSAMNEFLAHPEWMEKAKSAVEEYCREDVSADENNGKKDNIFSYVIPEFFFVKKRKKGPRVAMICRYRYDIEHGLAIIFSEGGKISVGSQDIV